MRAVALCGWECAGATSTIGASPSSTPIYLWVFLLLISTNIVYWHIITQYLWAHLEPGLGAGHGNTMNLAGRVSACWRLLIFISTPKDGPCPFWPSVFCAYCIVIWMRTLMASTLATLWTSCGRPFDALPHETPCFLGDLHECYVHFIVY